MTFKSASGCHERNAYPRRQGESKGIKCYFNGNVSIGTSTDKGGDAGLHHGRRRATGREHAGPDHVAGGKIQDRRREERI